MRNARQCLAAAAAVCIIAPVKSFVISTIQSHYSFRSLQQPRTCTFAMQASSSSSSSQVIVVGSANEDLIAYTSKLPELGETVMGTKFETSCGGKGANQAIAASKLDIVPVSMVCRVGQDSFGRELLNNFDNANVQYDKEPTILSSSDVSSGIAHIVVDQASGDNQIIVIPGANHELSPSDVGSELQSLIQKSDKSLVVVQLEIRPETALEALKVARREGATTILNTAPAPEDWSLDEFYPHTDILIPNETELRTICSKSSSTGNDDEEDMAKSLLAKGVQKAVLVTLGARGAMIVSSSNDDDKAVVKVDAPKELPCRNDDVVDTIGAGDAFCGALGTYLSAGLDLEQAAIKACGVASMSVRKKGAQASYPTSQELPECLQLVVSASAAQSATT